jgi:hypothetical protein
MAFYAVQKLTHQLPCHSQIKWQRSRNTGRQITVHHKPSDLTNFKNCKTVSGGIMFPFSTCYNSSQHFANHFQYTKYYYLQFCSFHLFGFHWILFLGFHHLKQIMYSGLDIFLLQIFKCLNTVSLINLLLTSIHLSSLIISYTLQQYTLLMQLV